VTQRIAAPALNPIDNATGWSSYNTNWEAIGPGVSYTLQRDAAPAFPSPVTVYTGTNTTSREFVSAIGTYYYRVKAADNGLESDWSSPQSVQVTQVGPEPGLYTGEEPDVFFVVTDDQRVCNYRITVPVIVPGRPGYYYCQISPPECAEISRDQYRFSFFRFATFEIYGRFDSPTHASGSQFVRSCGGTPVISAQGPWEATKVAPRATDHESKSR